MAASKRLVDSRKDVAQASDGPRYVRANAEIRNPKKDPGRSHSYGRDERRPEDRQAARSDGQRGWGNPNSIGLRDEPARQAHHHDPLRRRLQPSDPGSEQSPRKHSAEII